MMTAGLCANLMHLMHAACCLQDAAVSALWQPELITAQHCNIRKMAADGASWTLQAVMSFLSNIWMLP